MTEEKKCKHCAMMIPRDAKICPHCREKLGLTWPVKIFLALIVVGIFGAFIGNNTNSTSSAQKEAERPVVEAISITAEQLYKEYEANEVAADQKYKNKILNLSGTIRDIGKTIGDKPYINLATGRFSHQVMVSFPAKIYDNQLATYSNGMQLDLTGKCGGMTLGMVMINVK